MSKTEYLAAIAADIAEQRTALGLSQKTVAEAIGVAAASVANWERGRGVMSAYSLARLKTYFKQQWAAVLPDGAAGAKKLQAKEKPVAGR